MKEISLQKGFTLVEMIVSLAIFAIVAVVAVGALLRITDANKKSQSLKTAINNLNFALESMSREMRVGVNYAASSDIGGIGINGFNDVVKQSNSISTGNSWVVAFNTSKTADDGSGGFCNLINAYRYDKNEKTIMKAEQESCDSTEFVFHRLISPDVKITESILEVDSIDSDSTVQPKAFFWFKGYTGDRARDKTEFELQTTVSQRVET